MPKVINLPTATSMDGTDYLIMEESSGGTKKITRNHAFDDFPFYIRHVELTYNGTSAIGTVQEAMDNNTIPINLNGLTIAIVNAAQGANRIIAFCQNQSLGATTNRRLSAIIFGTYFDPVYTYKRETTNWTTVNML